MSASGNFSLGSIFFFPCMSAESKPPVPNLPPAGPPRSFSQFAAKAAALLGSSPAFLIAVSVIAAWGISGPYFHFSDSWQLVINTGTTIVTFLMVFLIQNTQNRDARALHLKLDEIIRSHRSARNEMLNIEKLGDEELEELASFYEQIRRECDQRNSSRQNSATRSAEKQSRQDSPS